MAHVEKSPGWISFARSRRGTWKGRVSLSESQPQLGKENEPPAWGVSGPQSHSKIHVLAKSHLPPDFQLPQQAWDSPFQKGKAACKKPSTETSFSFASKGDKGHAVPSVATAAAPELPAGSPDPRSRSQPRGPLEEIQLGAAAQNNTPGSSVPTGKEVGTVEFVADPVALASILSNVGLASSTLGVARKPSLAQRVPLRRSRGNSNHSNRSTKPLHGSLYAGLCPDPARSSGFSRLAAKDGDQPATRDPGQHCGLPLPLQQTQGLSATQKYLGAQAQPVGHPTLQSQGTGANQTCQGHPHPIATETWHEAARSWDAGRTGDQSTDSRPRSPNDVRAMEGRAGTGGQSASNSDVAMRKDPVGASQTEEFAVDPDALASILSNVGLSHAALGPTGKISLAQRVPVKGLRGVQPPTGGGTMGSRTSLLRPQVSGLPKGNFGRTSCRSVLGLKGLEAPDALQAARQPGTPRTREISRYSPYGLARRVPVTQPQSLRGSCFSSHRKVVFPHASRSGEPLDKRPAQGAVQSPARWTANLSPQPRSSDPDELALPWEKIVVRLFGDMERQTTAEVSARSSQTQPAIPQWSSKARCIEILAQLLQQEVEGAGGSLSLEGLYRFLAPHIPASCPLPPPSLPSAGSGLQQLCSPSSCCDRGLGPVPPASPAGFPAAGTTLTFSSQRPVCASPLIRSLRSHPTGRGAAGAEAAPTAPPSHVALVKQRLEHWFGARQRFREACLDDEVNFYVSRAPSNQPCAPRCPDPVARLLEAQETRYFIPIREPEPSDALMEAVMGPAVLGSHQPLR